MVGILISLLAGRVITVLLYETSPYDLAVLTATTLAFLAVAASASAIPAWHATTIDPAVLLRSVA